MLPPHSTKYILAKYKEYDYNDVEWLWYDWYDGPIEGMVKLNGQILYTHWFDDDEDNMRLFCLYELSPEEMKKEMYWEWLAEVCYRTRKPYFLETEKYEKNEYTKSFYWARKKLDYKEIEDAKIVGWFRW